MDQLDIRRAEWSKSSYSSANGQCIQVARNLPGLVAVRDSKNPDGPKLIFSPGDWRTFVSGVKSANFSL
ncbi:MAG: DUF397 domain-containing protein [Streptosporangiaceae bacterium]